jgi:hypothetical protein
MLATVIAFPRPDAAWWRLVYLGRRCAPLTKVESAKIRPSDLENRILWFSQLQIVLQLDQAQTVQARQGLARWSSSLKYCRVLGMKSASTPPTRSHRGSRACSRAQGGQPVDVVDAADNLPPVHPVHPAPRPGGAAAVADRPGLVRQG